MVTGVDIATIDDATFAAVHDASDGPPRAVHQGPGPRDPRRPGGVHRPLGPHRAAPVRAVDRGPPGDHRDLRPQPDHRHLALRLHLRQAAAVGEPAAGAHHPARRRRHDVLERVPGVRRPLRRAPRHPRARCARCTTPPSSRSTAACPSDEIVNAHPVVCTHPETGRHALFVNDNYTRHFDGWSIADSQPLLDLLYAQFDKPEHTWRHRWRRATSSSGTTAARSTPSSATPTAPVAHCTAPPSQEARPT